MKKAILLLAISLAAGGWRHGAGWSSQDGSQSAPNCSIQYPTLLTGLNGVTYTAPPPWMSPGIGYCVGYPTGQVFKDPTVDALPSQANGGCISGTPSVNTVSKFVRLSSSVGCVFDGWDFSVGGGYYLYVDGTASNTTVTNSRFICGANAKCHIQSDATAGNLTVTRTLIDQQGINTGIEAIRAGAQANLTVQYVFCTNASSDCIHVGSGLGGATGGGNHDVRFNLMSNIMWADGQHSDFLQIVGAIQSLRFQFNTFYQGPANGSGFPGSASSVIQTGDMVSGQSNDGIDMGWNVVVAIGSTGHRQCNPGCTSTGNAIAIAIRMTGGGFGSMVSPSIHDNYLTYTIAAPEMFDWALEGTNVTGASWLRNINMVTGATFAAP